MSSDCFNPVLPGNPLKGIKANSADPDQMAHTVWPLMVYIVCEQVDGGKSLPV